MTSTEIEETTLGELGSRHLGKTVTLIQRGDPFTLTVAGPMVILDIQHQLGSTRMYGQTTPQMIMGPPSTPCEIS